METRDIDGKLVGTISQQVPASWKVYVDGAANQKGFRVGLVLVSPESITIKKSLRLGMSMVQKLGKKVVNMFSDSRLVVGQVNGELEARDERMLRYLSQVKHLQSHFDSFNLLHIPRNGNTHANSLATLATSSAQSLPRVILVEDLCKP